MMLFIETTPLWLPWIVLQIVLIIASSFFSAAETALFSISRDELRRMSVGDVVGRRIAGLLKNPDRLLTVVLFWNLIINLAYFAVSLVTARRLIQSGQSEAAAIIAIVGFVLLLVIGEVLPKVLAVLFTNPIARFSALSIVICARLLDPILPILGASTRALRRAFWPNLVQEPYLNVEDIERAVETTESGVELAQLEQEILGRVLELSDMTAEELMRPRGTYDLWPPTVTLQELIEHGERHGLILISGEDRDIVEKSLNLSEKSRIPETNLADVADAVIYVPWCATVSDTLVMLRTGLSSVAAVINEYGETVGVLSEDDILDTILNPDSSRTQRLLNREPIIEAENGDIISSGFTNLRDVADHFDIHFDADQDDTHVTIAALLQHELERFPQVGDTCSWDELNFLVQKAGAPGEEIQVLVTRIPKRDDA